MELMIDLFESQARVSPQSIALRLENGNEFTYQTINNLADNIARVVCPSVKPNDSIVDVDTPLIAIMMARDVGVLVSILAILKSGSAYVPVGMTLFCIFVTIYNLHLTMNRSFIPT